MNGVGRDETALFFLSEFAFDFALDFAFALGFCFTGGTSRVMIQKQSLRRKDEGGSTKLGISSSY